MKKILLAMVSWKYHWCLSEKRNYAILVTQTKQRIC